MKATLRLFGRVHEAQEYYPHRRPGEEKSPLEHDSWRSHIHARLRNYDKRAFSELDDWDEENVNIYLAKPILQALPMIVDEL